jgi:hypothetical protein
MDTSQLAAILQSDKYAKNNFTGVFAADRLQSLHVKKYPACFIVNSDPSWKPGTHWLAIYMDHNHNVEFFDSYGQSPSKYPMIFDFMRTYTGHYKMNFVQLQSSLSSTCGQFCIYFLLWRCRSVSFEQIMNAFDPCQETNDLLVTTFVNGIFDLNTKTYDVDYIVNQCCKARFCGHAHE